MKNTIISLVLLSAFSALNLLAETIYIDDTSAIIWSRTGPSNAYKVKYKFPPGVKLEVLLKDEEAGFTQVKDNRGRVSWLNSNYLTSKVSNKELLDKANRKIASLEKSYNDLENRFNQLSSLEGVNRELKDKLLKLELDYEMLREQNQMHKSGFYKDVLFSGAGVVLGGMFIGWILARTLGRKRKDGWK